MRTATRKPTKKVARKATKTITAPARNKAKAAPAAPALPVLRCQEVPARDKRRSSFRDVLLTTSGKFLALFPHDYSTRPTRKHKTFAIGGLTYTVEWAK
jgi:hypothetical protein